MCHACIAYVSRQIYLAYHACPVVNPIILFYFSLNPLNNPDLLIPALYTKYIPRIYYKRISRIISYPMYMPSNIPDLSIVDTPDIHNSGLFSTKYPGFINLHKTIRNVYTPDVYTTRTGYIVSQQIHL